mmetsp:Transcript_135375/g.289443  ORF Transcript_135375/g.289443 Transcript_135375/m.289443 type:complete len:240 (+) Transcript_135375:523-1242(+)
MLREHRIADSCQVRRFPKIVAPSASPNENIVSQVTNCIPGFLLRACHSSPEGRDMFVIPSIAVRYRSPLGDPRDLIPIVPPCHDTRVLRGICIDPLVPIIIVGNFDNTLNTVLGGEDNLRAGEGMRDGVTVLHKCLHFWHDAAQTVHVKHDGDRDETPQQQQKRLTVQLHTCLMVLVLHCLWYAALDRGLHDPLQFRHASRPIVFLILCGLYQLLRRAALRNFLILTLLTASNTFIRIL